MLTLDTEDPLPEKVGSCTAVLLKLYVKSLDVNTSLIKNDQLYSFEEKFSVNIMSLTSKLCLLVAEQ